MHKRPARVLVALLLLAALPVASQAFVTVGVSITVAPPPLPVYEQPPIPTVGYMWAPGYWAWGGDDYYWVPGTWVPAPEPGLLWTPGYWGWVNGTYAWHEGYWGPQIGFYGGVDYGFGYVGTGFAGGEWRNGTFFYNRSVVNVGSVHITNVYERNVVNNVTVNRVSFNGGSGGTQARPTPGELAAARERHIPATPVQHQHEQLARDNPQLRAAANGGHPAIAATARPTEFSGRAVIAARDAGPAQRTDRPPGATQHAGGSASPPAEHAPPAAHDEIRRNDRPAPAPVHEAPHAQPPHAPPPHAPPPREEKPREEPRDH